jgi:hypothetical protein
MSDSKFPDLYVVPTTVVHIKKSCMFIGIQYIQYVLRLAADRQGFFRVGFFFRVALLYILPLKIDWSDILPKSVDHVPFVYPFSRNFLCPILVDSSILPKLTIGVEIKNKNYNIIKIREVWKLFLTRNSKCVMTGP